MTCDRMIAFRKLAFPERQRTNGAEARRDERQIKSQHYHHLVDEERAVEERLWVAVGVARDPAL
eukprot:CAMPEP_0185252498 /NCGR_PEP_ID=MMETSP1359-20130426/1568_1 /TAXON_ID=552665 /ORGANISM="Bigelowiella longifila, Strain CCMP242" /LENGTH=63 /DNA_ID=CAMNT_0027834671 /DNA_START=160 /DNA_END=355 /DNA_ORIENTATION=+